MKVKFDIECTPAEARAFFGLPDIVPMQEAMMKEMEDKMRENMNAMDTEAFMKTWMAPSMQSWSEMQKMFWGQMGLTPSSTTDNQSNTKAKK